jgi:hypothetical protein
MPIQIDAKLNAFRRSPKGFFITLEVAPDSDWEELARAPLGQAFGVAMVAYDSETGKASPGIAAKADGPNTGEQRGEAGKPQAEKPRQPFHKLSRAQQAGILCQDPMFGLWLANAHPDLASLDSCATAVRMICGVTSRSELSEDRVAGKKWDQLVTSFQQATGRMAEAR